MKTLKESLDISVKSPARGTIWNSVVSSLWSSVKETVSDSFACVVWGTVEYSVEHTLLSSVKESVGRCVKNNMRLIR